MLGAVKRIRLASATDRVARPLVVLAAVAASIAPLPAAAQGRLEVRYVPWHTYRGGTFFGFSVSGAGDLNGDLVPDVVVGAPYENGNFSGNVYTYSGADGSLINRISGEQRGELAAFGISVSGIGDVNGNGRGEIIVGAEDESHFVGDDEIEKAGSATVFRNGSDLPLYEYYGAEFADSTGWSVSGALDVNNDGVNDFIYSAPDADSNGLGNNGAAYVMSGATGAELHSFRGTQDLETLGFSVAGLGDVNNDGHSDVAVGSPGYRGDRGRVQVFSGADGTRLRSYEGNPGNRLGEVVAGVGDIDMDGENDVIAGIPRANRIWFRSIDGGVSSNISRPELSRFGDAVAGGLGDINGDGNREVVVGAPGSDKVVIMSVNGVFSGQIHQEFTGNDNDEFGTSVAGIGDVNNDGFGDFIAGASGGGYARSYASVIGERATTAPIDPGNQVVVDDGMTVWGNVQTVITGGTFTVFQTTDATVTRGYALAPSFLPGGADGADAQFWEIDFDGEFDGPLELFLPYNEFDNAGRSIEDYPLTLYHFNGTEWEVPPQEFDLDANIVTTTVDSLSPFVLVHDFPTDATPLGDFNGDGVVDAADYTVWRDSAGQTGDDLPADGNVDGVVDSVDYELWRANYRPSTDGGLSTVPEPTGATCLFVAAGALALQSGRGWGRPRVG